MITNNMVIKVCIVDDEYLVRELLKRSINWPHHNMEIVGETGNPLEVMQMVREKLPDIIFMDICMPIKNGIELSELILASYPEIFVVILTGHNEFEYARDSVNVGITNFISKPINNLDINQVLEKLKERVEKRRRVASKTMEQKERMETQSIKLREVEAELIQLKNFLRHVAKQNIFNCEKNHESHTTELIEGVKAFINKHFINKELSLTTVAKEFYVHPNHLSRRFSQEVGITFKDYLMTVRIEEALRLIKSTDLKNYEIAARIGIDDPNYFSVFFKKFLQMTVSDYKKNLVAKQ